MSRRKGREGGEGVYDIAYRLVSPVLAALFTILEEPSLVHGSLVPPGKVAAAGLVLDAASRPERKSRGSGH